MGRVRDESGFSPRRALILAAALCEERARSDDSGCRYARLVLRTQRPARAVRRARPPTQRAAVAVGAHFSTLRPDSIVPSAEAAESLRQPPASAVSHEATGNFGLATAAAQRPDSPAPRDQREINQPISAARRPVQSLVRSRGVRGRPWGNRPLEVQSFGFAQIRLILPDIRQLANKLPAILAELCDHSVEHLQSHRLGRLRVHRAPGENLLSLHPNDLISRFRFSEVAYPRGSKIALVRGRSAPHGHDRAVLPLRPALLREGRSDERRHCKRDQGHPIHTLCHARPPVQLHQPILLPTSSH